MSVLSSVKKKDIKQTFPAEEIEGVVISGPSCWNFVQHKWPHSVEVRGEMEARRIPYWNAVQTMTSDTWPHVIMYSFRTTFCQDKLSG